MESIQPGTTENENQGAVTCAGCNIPVGYSGTGTPLCEPCRNHFVKYPIPKPIKLFGIGILLVMIVAFFSLPQSLSSGIHLKRGKKAAKLHKFVTAQKEFQAVADQNPRYEEAQARLLMAAYYNNDRATMSEAFAKLKGKEVKDESLYEEVNDIIQKANDVGPSDSFARLVAVFNNNYDSVPENLFHHFLQNPEPDYYAYLAYASRCYNYENYNRADSLINIVLQHNGDDLTTLNLKISIKRQKEQLDSALHFINHLLSLNSESVFALSAKSRVFLSQKRDREALELAKTAHALNENDGYTMASLALALHFNGNNSARDNLIKRAEKDSVWSGYFSYVHDVMSGKEILRK